MTCYEGKVLTQEFDKICSIVPMATSDVEAYHLFDYTTVFTTCWCRGSAWSLKCVHWTHWRVYTTARSLTVWLSRLCDEPAVYLNTFLDN